MIFDLTPEEYAKVDFFIRNPKFKISDLRIGYKIYVPLDNIDGPRSLEIRRVIYALNSSDIQHYVQSAEIDKLSTMQLINVSLIAESVEDAKNKIRHRYETDLLNLQIKYSVILD